MKAPFPYFGGKRMIADLVWQRFGRLCSPAVRTFFPNSSHEGTVIDSFFNGVSGLDGNYYMTFFASGLQSVSGAAVFIKFRVQFCKGADGTSLIWFTEPIFIFVSRIVRCGSPSKIFKMIIRFAGIGIMTGLVANGSRSDKGFENEALNLPTKDLASAVKIDNNITGTVFMSLQSSSFSDSTRSFIIATLPFECPNRSVIPNKIIFKSYNWPEFCVHV